MTLMPGVTWRPITVPGGLVKRTPGRAVILHVAASEATSLFGFFNGNTSANSHFYVAKNGAIEQYIDTAYQSWTSLAANKNTIGVETQGGVTNPDGEQWTAAQVASLARICAWAHATDGVPLTLMPNSLPTSRGIGYHRLGIDPWRVPGGEVWSSSRGKLCPGAAKIAQVPQIVALAAGATSTVQEDDMWFIHSPGRGFGFGTGGYWKVLNAEEAQDVAIVLGRQAVECSDRGWDVIRAVAVNGQVLSSGLPGLDDVRQKVVAARYDLADRPGPDADDLLGHVLSIRALVAKLTTGATDPQAVADAILAKLPAQPAAAGGLTKDDVTAAVKSVFAAAGQP